MQQWLAKAVVVFMDAGGFSSTGTLMSYDQDTFTVQEVGGLMTYPLSRLFKISAA